MHRDSFEFDLVTQRFLKNRWDTELGQKAFKTDFSGADIRGIYLESARLENLTVNYSTQLDETLNCQWNAREMPRREMPDHLKALRIAFEKAELWQMADKYLYSAPRRLG